MELKCPVCEQVLRVGDDTAGKQARCPKCQAVFLIPSLDGAHGSTGTDESQYSDSGTNQPTPGLHQEEQAIDSPHPFAATNPTGQSPPDEAEQAWHVKIEDGRTYGPVSREELDEWFSENRISAECLLRRDKEVHWLYAGSIFPQLGAPQSSTLDPSSGHYSYDATGTGNNPYRAPHQLGQQLPHRGGMVLTFGILGFLGTCCPLFLAFSIAAWVIGHNDKAKMAMSEMDSSGHSLTSAGQILGVIGTVIGGITTFFWIVGTIG